MPFDMRAYNAQYERLYIVRRVLKFNRRSEDDARLLDWLSRQENITEYCKALIREDMRRHAESEPCGE